MLLVKQKLKHSFLSVCVPLFSPPLSISFQINDSVISLSLLTFNIKQYMKTWNDFMATSTTDG